MCLFQQVSIWLLKSIVLIQLILNFNVNKRKKYFVNSWYINAICPEPAQKKTGPVIKPLVYSDSTKFVTSFAATRIPLDDHFVSLQDSLTRLCSAINPGYI